MKAIVFGCLICVALHALHANEADETPAPGTNGGHGPPGGNVTTGGATAHKRLAQGPSPTRTRS